MEKLLELINEYEESRWTTIDDWLTEEERENWATIEENPTRKEYEWHLRHCNAKTVAYEKDTFDAYALSKKYGFVRWLLENWYIIPYTAVYSPIEWRTIWFNNWVTATTVNDSIFDSLTAYLATSNNPISDLINLLS
jgi:hypothetical protein